MLHHDHRVLFRTQGDFAKAQRTKCAVCGHRTVPIVRRSLNWVFVMLLGATLMYIALDVAENGRLDGRILHAIEVHHGANR